MTAIVTKARLPIIKQKHINSVKQIRYLDKTSRRSHVPFQLASAHGSVGSAEKLAEWFRGKGFNARIVKWSPKGREWARMGGNQFHDTSVGEMKAGVFIRPKDFGYSFKPGENFILNWTTQLNNGAIRELRSKQLDRIGWVGAKKPPKGKKGKYGEPAFYHQGWGDKAKAIDWGMLREIPMLPGDENEEDREEGRMLNQAIPIYDRKLEDRTNRLDTFGEEMFGVEIGTDPEIGLDRPLNARERDELESLLSSSGISSRFQRKLLIIQMPDEETVSYGFLTAPEAVDILYSLGVFPETGDIAEWLQGDSSFNESMRLTSANRKRLTQLLVRNSISDPAWDLGVDDSQVSAQLRGDVGFGSNVDFRVFEENELDKVYEKLPDLATTIEPYELESAMATFNEGSTFSSQVNDAWEKGYIDPYLIIQQLRLDYPDLSNDELNSLYDDLNPEDVELMFGYNTMEWDDAQRVEMMGISGFRDGEGLGANNEMFDIDNPNFQMKIPKRIIGYQNSARNYGVPTKDRMTFDEKSAFSKLIWGV